MAQVTYRGVSYDMNTNDRKDSVQSASQLTYRGIKHTSITWCLVRINTGGVVTLLFLCYSDK